jgi:hypothetical protein
MAEEDCRALAIVGCKAAGVFTPVETAFAHASTLAEPATCASSSSAGHCRANRFWQPATASKPIMNRKRLAADQPTDPATTDGIPARSAQSWMPGQAAYRADAVSARSRKEASRRVSECGMRDKISRIPVKHRPRIKDVRDQGIGSNLSSDSGTTLSARVILYSVSAPSHLSQILLSSPESSSRCSTSLIFAVRAGLSLAMPMPIG